jgi:hypothetical protein
LRWLKKVSRKHLVAAHIVTGLTMLSGFIS